MKAYDLGAKAIIFSQFVNMLDVSDMLPVVFLFLFLFLFLLVPILILIPIPVPTSFH